MLGEGLSRKIFSGIRELVGEGYAPTGLRVPCAMVVEGRFRSEPIGDRAKIDEVCLTTGSRGDRGLLGKRFSPTELIVGTFSRVFLGPKIQWLQYGRNCPTSKVLRNSPWWWDIVFCQISHCPLKVCIMPISEVLEGFSFVKTEQLLTYERRPW